MEHNAEYREAVAAELEQTKIVIEAKANGVDDPRSDEELAANLESLTNALAVVDSSIEATETAQVEFDAAHEALPAADADAEEPIDAEG